MGGGAVFEMMLKGVAIGGLTRLVYICRELLTNVARRPAKGHCCKDSFLINFAMEKDLHIFRALAPWTMLWAGLFPAVSYSQAPGNSKDAKEKEATCRVLGMVVKVTDGAPLKGATVRLENGEDHEHTIATKTTGDGRFELRNVPGGATSWSSDGTDMSRRNTDKGNREIRKGHLTCRQNSQKRRSLLTLFLQR